MDVRKPAERGAFTLIELLVVITIIAILMGLLFPVFQGAQNQAKRTQAKNDVTQIVTAVDAFYTEYGQYPVAGTADTTVGGASAPNDKLFDALRGIDVTVNPKAISFLTAPDVKDPLNPRAGIGTTTGKGQYFDPWGTPYFVAIDGNYDDQIANPYSSNAGSPDLRLGAISWSIGADKKTDAADKKSADSDDDVISWQ